MNKFIKEKIESGHRPNHCRGCGVKLDVCAKLDIYCSYGYLMIKCPVCQFENTVEFDGNRVIVTLRNVSLDMENNG